MGEGWGAGGIRRVAPVVYDGAGGGGGGRVGFDG